MDEHETVMGLAAAVVAGAAVVVSLFAAGLAYRAARRAESIASRMVDAVSRVDAAGRDERARAEVAGDWRRTTWEPGGGAEA